VNDLAAEAFAETEPPARRLHPATLVTATLRLVPQLVFGAAGYAALVQRAGLAQVVTFAFSAALLAAVIAGLSWWRFTYRVRPGELVVERGILSRQRRVIPFDRVQDIAIEQKLLARLFGTARVKVETGGSAADEADLDMIALDDAHQLRDIVRRHGAAVRGAEGPWGARAVEESADEEPLLFKMELGRVLGSGLFNFSLVFLAVLFGGLQYVEAVTDLGLYDAGRWFVPAEAAAAQVTLQVGLLLAALLLLAGMASGILRTLARDYGFRLTRSVNGLRRRRGLFTLSEVVIPVRRTQVALIESGLFPRLLGWHQLAFQTLGADPKEGGVQTAAPFARMEELLPILAEPGFPDPPPSETFHRLPRRALARRVGPPIALAFVAGAAALLIHPYAAIGTAALLLVALAAGFRWRRHVYAMGESALFVRGGLLRRRTWIIPFEKAQTVWVTRSPLQRGLGLSSLLVDTAGAATLNTPTIVDLDSRDAARLAARLIDLFHVHRARARRG
jgi:putative membrane protein